MSGRVCHQHPAYLSYQLLRGKNGLLGFENGIEIPDLRRKAYKTHYGYEEKKGSWVKTLITVNREITSKNS
jgi:hypothetical protein